MYKRSLVLLFRSILDQLKKMKQYHFRLKAGNFSNSYFITDSNRDRAFDSAQWEFFKDCEAQGFVAMSCLLEFEEVNEI